jgi:hypothetical protein
MKLQTHLIYWILLLMAIIGLLGQHSCINNLQAKIDNLEVRLKEKCPEGVIVTDTTKVKDSSSTGWHTPQPTDITPVESLRIPGQIPPESVPGYLESHSGKRGEQAGSTPRDTVSDPVVSTDRDESREDDYFYKPLLYFYSDTVPFKYGKVIIQDSTPCPILSRNVIPLFEIPVVTKTNTISLKEPPRMRGFLSILAQGNQFYPLQAAGGGFLLQFKNYNAVEVDALYNFHPLYPGQVPWTYQVSYKPLITFRKK